LFPARERPKKPPKDDPYEKHPEHAWAITLIGTWPRRPKALGMTAAEVKAWKPPLKITLTLLQLTVFLKRYYIYLV